jgi:hypothetical protein
MESIVDELEYQQRKEAALLKLELCADLHYKFFTNEATDIISIPGSTKTIIPLAAYTQSLETLPTDIENSWETITNVMNNLPVPQ